MLLGGLVALWPTHNSSYLDTGNFVSPYEFHHTISYSLILPIYATTYGRVYMSGVSIPRANSPAGTDRLGGGQGELGRTNLPVVEQDCPTWLEPSPRCHRPLPRRRARARRPERGRGLRISLLVRRCVPPPRRPPPARRVALRREGCAHAVSRMLERLL
jgi:hypothetical protein